MPAVTLTEMIRNDSGEIATYAWPGGYPLYYACKDGGVLCAKCVNANIKLILDATLEDLNTGWEVAGADINYEDQELTCDNCNAQIEAAYTE